MIPSFQYNGILGWNLSQVSYVKAFYQVFCSLRINKRLGGDCLVPLDPVTYRHTYTTFIVKYITGVQIMNDSFGTKQSRFFMKKTVHKKNARKYEFKLRRWCCLESLEYGWMSSILTEVIKSFALHKNCAASVRTPRSFRCLAILW